MIKDYQIFKEAINRNIQNSKLDVGAVYFILKDILRDVENLYYSQINKEYLEMENKKVQLNTNSNDGKSEDAIVEAEES